MHGTVQRVIDKHECKTVADVTRLCRAGAGCRSCHVEIDELLTLAAAKRGGFWRRLLRRFRS